MDALRIWEFSLSQTMNCQTVVFLLKKAHSSLLICSQFCLECSGEWFFYHQIRDSGEKTKGAIKVIYEFMEWSRHLKLTFITFSLDWTRYVHERSLINKMEKHNYDLMRECSIQFSMFYKFTQTRQIDSRQSSQN